MNNRLYGNLIFELSKPGRKGYSLPKNRFGNYEVPQELRRQQDAELPECDEMTVVRHYTNLSANNFGVDNGFAQMFLEAGIARCFPSLEEPEFAQNGGSSANGCQRNSLSRFLFEQFAQVVASQQVSGAGHSSREEDDAGVVVVAKTEDGVGHNRDVVGSHYRHIFVNRNGGYFYARAAQDVNGSEGFDFLKAVCEKNVDSFHGIFGVLFVSGMIF